MSYISEDILVTPSRSTLKMVIKISRGFSMYRGNIRLIIMLLIWGNVMISALCFFLYFNAICFLWMVPNFCIYKYEERNTLIKISLNLKWEHLSWINLYYFVIIIKKNSFCNKIKVNCALKWLLQFNFYINFWTCSAAG